MPAGSDYAALLGRAEAAAAAGELARAADWLADALAHQRAALGPAHPDIASTCNNLAILRERLGDLDAAEQLYRRAYAIAAGAGPGAEARAAEARDNLRAFCQAHDRPFEDGRPDPVDPLDEFAPSLPATVPAPPPPDRAAAAAASVAPAAAARTGRRATAPRSAQVWRGLVAALAVVALAGTAVVFLTWQGPTAGPATDALASRSAATSAPRQPAPAGDAPAIGLAPSVSTAPVAAAARPAPEPSAALRGNAARSATAPAAPPARPAPVPEGGLEVRSAAICRSLDAGGDWRCEPLDQPAEAGAVTFLTRIASARTSTVRHRWMQDGRVRRVVSLVVGASPGAGYRTFSMLRVTTGRWTVALLDAGDAVLHEATFDVR